MRRGSIIAGAMLLALSGCPLPQPLAEYPKGTVTPPRILMDEIKDQERETVIRVPAGCTGAPSYDLTASLVDNDTSETVTARWFVDYDRTSSGRCFPVTPQEEIRGPGDGGSSPTRREVTAYHFVPYDHPAYLGASSTPAGAGVVHVVELVVSNRFDPTADSTTLCTKETAARPFRTPANDGGVQFETQTFRWVFVSEPSSTDLPCP